MTKQRKRVRILALLLALVMVLGTAASVSAAEGDAEIREAAAETDLTGMTVILHSNDVHGAVDEYAKAATLRRLYEAKGAEVFLLDAGDFSQGSPYVNLSRGRDAVVLMNAAGYDLATPGNHELDFSVEQLRENLDLAAFPVISANVFRDGIRLWEPYTVLSTKSGLNIGFFGLLTPETRTKANPKLVSELTFLSGEEMALCAQEQIDALRDQGADVVIALTHLGVAAETLRSGNSSLDLYRNTSGIDFIIDGHSHTVMTEGPEGEPIQSAGTEFAYIGVLILDENGAVRDHYLVPAEGLEEDEAVSAAVGEVKKEADTILNQVFAVSELEFEGRSQYNRTRETNSGDLITDAMLWYMEQNADLLEVPMDRVLALQNGGGIRDRIPEGNVTKRDINTVYPFGNTVTVVYVTGEELLEVLEASTFNIPDTLGGYPQTAGIRFTVDAAQAYDAGEAYPNSTYFRPNSIRRVTVESIGGKPFDPSLTYALVTNNFLTSGGDTAYLLGTKEAMDLGLPLDELLAEYISQALGGVLSAAKYGQVRGDQTILLPGAETGAPEEKAPETVTYTVAAGDCLWNLARRYYGRGTLFGKIAEANGIAAPYMIYVGQTLRIPDAA